MSGCWTEAWRMPAVYTQRQRGRCVCGGILNPSLSLCPPPQLRLATNRLCLSHAWLSRFGSARSPSPHNIRHRYPTTEKPAAAVGAGNAGTDAGAVPQRATTVVAGAAVKHRFFWLWLDFDRFGLFTALCHPTHAVYCVSTRRPCVWDADWCS